MARPPRNRRKKQSASTKSQLPALREEIEEKVASMEREVGEALQFTWGQNLALGFLANIYVVGRDNPQAVYDGLQRFLAETLQKPQYDMPPKMREGVKTLVEAYLASLAVAINEAKRDRRKSLIGFAKRVGIAVLSILGWHFTPVSDLVPEMWQSAWETVAEELILRD